MLAVVRALLVPALAALFGGWNWWLRRPARRLLRIPAPPPAGAPAPRRPPPPATGAPDGLWP